jgi:hypothetical protein
MLIEDHMQIPDSTEIHKGIRFFVGAFICIFVTVHLMFEYREAEARLGIERKC